MKKPIILFAAASLLCSLTSCEDWLEMPSESSASSESVFTTLSRAEMAVVGAYPSLHTQELGYQLLEGTDESASKENNSKYNVSNYDYTNLTGMLSNTYISMYKAIEYANACVDNLPKVPVSTDAERERLNGLMGEALAIRAYAYWNLVRFYGDVPFSLASTLNMTTFESSRESRDVIYDQCVADLQEATRLLPWRSESYVATPERFTKNAAYGILARVALYAAGYSLRWDLSQVPYDNSTVRIAQRDDATRIRELYQISADACQAVITKGEDDLLADYDKIFRDYALKQYNKESMLEYGWYGTHSVDCRTGYTNGIPTTGESSVIGKGGSQMMAMPTFYFEFEDGDQRRDVSICNYALKLNKSGDSYRMNTFAGMGVGKYRINWKSEIGTSNSRRDINFPILRFADVLLMYAEALNELHNGPTPEAIAAVKRVRMRAFRNDAAKAGAIPNTYQAFREFIMQERKLELNNEGLRRTDLTRWGQQYEMLMAEKAKLVELCNRTGRYADIPQYWAFRITQKPQLKDPVIALPHIEISESDLALIGLSSADIDNLHIINSASKGLVKAKLIEADGQVYLNRSLVPAGASEVKEVEYEILNMWSVNTSTQKGNLSTVKIDGQADNNAWVTGATGIFYGLTKNKTELMPFHQTNIIDVNPGLAGQQHPGYN